jgi:hypothetical protein
MIEWKQVKEEKPPIDKPILYATSYYLKNSEYTFDVFIATVSHPFSKDEKFHPDYYLVHYRNSHGNYNEEKVKSQHFWAPINTPDMKEK